MIRDKILLVILVAPFFFVMTACNPVSEDVTDPSWNSLHNSKPFQSEVFHSADYRFPVNACDEPQCHGSDLTNGNSGAPSCFSCHDNQWSVFNISHTKQISGYYHRSDVDDYPADRENNEHWLDSCKTAGCHGATLDGNQPLPGPNAQYRYSCKSCHTGFSGTIPPPGHSRKKSDDGQTGWHHFRYESADEDGGSGNVTYCGGAACHGADGESSVAASGLFGRSPACDECH